MRRKEREVTDTAELFSILTRCDTIRIGISGAKHPYVVPVSFGAELTDGKLSIYLEAGEGVFIVPFVSAE